MNEIELLSRVGDQTQPDADALARARSRVLSEAAPAVRRPRRRWPVVAGVAAAAACTALAVTLVSLPGPQGAQPAQAAAVLLRTAAIAEDAPAAGPGRVPARRAPHHPLVRRRAR
ncbi:MAG: hypothetical protein ACI379_08865 [Nocardioides sp.]|uniref:hypothetical protein n=1 Tax=Nocardioides sp. TaxID=35761 RepID=UPI003F06F011